MRADRRFLAPVFLLSNQLLSNQPFGDVSGYGQLETLTLVGLDHAVDPQEKSEQAQGPEKN